MTRETKIKNRVVKTPVVKRIEFRVTLAEQEMLKAKKLVRSDELNEKAKRRIFGAGRRSKRSRLEIGKELKTLMGVLRLIPILRYSVLLRKIRKDVAKKNRRRKSSKECAGNTCTPLARPCEGAARRPGAARTHRIHRFYPSSTAACRGDHD